MREMAVSDEMTSDRGKGQEEEVGVSQEYLRCLCYPSRVKREWYVSRILWTLTIETANRRQQKEMIDWHLNLDLFQCVQDQSRRCDT
jgi:hypothetical protein